MIFIYIQQELLLNESIENLVAKDAEMVHDIRVSHSHSQIICIWSKIIFKYNKIYRL